MDSLLNDYARGLLTEGQPPCLTLYQRTHRHHPDNQQDPIRYRNLLRQLEASLALKYPAADVEALIEPFRALAADDLFWTHMRGGLAVLGAPGFFRVYRLHRPMRDLAVVAGTFHLKPLIRILQSADRYQVLGLHRQAVRLFEGDRDVLDEVTPAPDVPKTSADVVGTDRTQPHMTVAAYGGTGSQFSYQGHGGKSQEVQIDTERYFRAVDRAVLEGHSRPSGLPLILATLPEHRTVFRRISHNPFLIEPGIDVHPDALTIDELRERAWQAVEPSYQQRLGALLDAYGHARGRQMAAADLAEIALAVVSGRVATLLIDADREIPGRIDSQTGEITPGDMSDPEIDDVIDDLGTMAMERGAQVIVVPRDRMPTETGAAATFRF